MLTEYQALYIAQEHAEKAMDVLEAIPSGSYYADEAHGKLGEALGALESGLRYFEMDDGAVGCSGAVGTPGGDQGEGEGVLSPHTDDGSYKDWLKACWCRVE